MTAGPVRAGHRPRASAPELSVAGVAEGDPIVEVRRSARRRSTVSAYRDGDRTVVLIPARMSRAEERRWVNVMLERLARQDRKLRPGDEELTARASALSKHYLDGQARPVSVRWVTNQGSRWGSCTPADGTIRLSDRLQGMPGWVLDYVLVHELAHLLVPGHGPAFWEQVERYPRTERARGYLEGVSATAGLRMADDEDDDESGVSCR
jgi:predicted metal-dependent hydrolase